MDGTLGSRTALMLDGSGVRITTRDQLEELILAGAAAGWPVSVHAIGDLANRDALDAFEATKDTWAPLGLRHRIEHAQCLDPADIPRFAEIGVACSVQLSHAPSDRDLAERFWETGSKAPMRFGRSGIPAPSSPTARTRPSRSSIRSPASAPESCGRSTIAPPGARTSR